MENNTENKFVFEDISSTSPTFKSEMVDAANEYSNGAFRNIDKVIKVISFIVAIAIALVFFAIAAVLVMLDKTFTVIAVAVVVVGLVLSLICLFLIYGIGHIITQNKQILRHLRF